MAGNYLVETALLTHGLASFDNQQIAASWQSPSARLAWLDTGEIIIGSLQDYLPFRKRWQELQRIDYENLAHAVEHKLSGAFTASGTMAVCSQVGIPLAVTVGMGGIGAVKGEELCPDLLALAQLPVALIATAFKDMLDAKATIEWLNGHRVKIWGRKQPYYDGFLFRGEQLAIDSLYTNETLSGQMLLLSPLPKRLTDNSILTQAIVAAEQAAQAGQYYHPAANAEIDRLSAGLSSKWQLQALNENILWAESIVE